MDMILDILSDACIDTLKLIPFLFVTYLAMEALESKAGGHTERAIRKAGPAGPAVGALLGALPQCGFSTAASTLYAGRVITIGTLFAVFLSTSDEMLPIFIAEQVDASLIFSLLGIKVVIGMITGFAIDAFMRVYHRHADNHMHIHDLCERDHCKCEEGIFVSALRHTLQVTLFIFLVTLAIAALIAFIGEDTFATFIASNPVLSVVASAVVGLIPNCAASVIITELYLEGTLGFGATMAGLLVSAGVGLLVLLRTNRPFKDNLIIIGVLLVCGIVWGLGFQLTGFSL